MTKKHRSPDSAPAIIEHFANGGGPLTSRDIAEKLDMTPEQGSKVMGNLIRSARYSVRVEWLETPRGKIRVLHEIKRQVTPAETRRRELKAALIAKPAISNTTLAQQYRCSTHTVRAVRRGLESDGSIPAVPASVAERSAGPADRQTSDWIIPTARHPSDEPHLAKAARFRQIWPVGRQHAG